MPIPPAQSLPGQFEVPSAERLALRRARHSAPTGFTANNKFAGSGPRRHVEAAPFRVNTDAESMLLRTADFG